MLEQDKIAVQNCILKKLFAEDIKHPLFPIRGSGIVSLATCTKCTDLDEDARLVTDAERNLLFCRTDTCDNHTEESP